MRYALKYDLRAPDFGAPLQSLYRACLDQCRAADTWGFERVFLLEHHGTDDNYCPSPLILGTAIAASTAKMLISPAALIAPLHEPLRIAEDLAVLDQISGGRVEVVLGAGYSPDEFAMFGRDVTQRGAAMSEIVQVLKDAWTGEPFQFRGRTVRVTPRPARQPRPPIFLGGMTAAAARRAARVADGFWPVNAALEQEYRAECEREGHPPGVTAPRGYVVEPFVSPRFTFVSEDPERDWNVVLPHALHESVSYAQLARSAGARQQSNTPAMFQDEHISAEDIRSGGNYMVMTPEACIQMYRGLAPDGMVVLHPLLAGLDPEASWSSLTLFAERVMPRLNELTVDVG
ncbi:MAG: LLM class flavin-dependent oxidoreductase [Acidimicrobiia bacterium]